MNLADLTAHCRTLSPAALKAHLNSLIPFVAKLNNNKEYSSRSSVSESSESETNSSVASKPLELVNQKRKATTRCDMVKNRQRNGSYKHVRFNEAVVGTRVFCKLDRLYTTAQSTALSEESIMLLKSGNIEATVVATYSNVLIIQLDVIGVFLQMSPQMFYYETTSISSTQDLSVTTLLDMKHSTYIRDREQFNGLQRLCRESHRAVDDFTPPIVTLFRQPLKPSRAPCVRDDQYHSSAGVARPLWTPAAVEPVKVSSQFKPVVLMRSTVGVQRPVYCSSSSDSEEKKEEEKPIVYRQMVAKKIKQSTSPRVAVPSTPPSHHNTEASVTVSTVSTTKTTANSTITPPKIRYSATTKKHSPKFVRCSVDETVSIRLMCLYARPALDEMETDEQQVLKFTTVDATVVDKSSNDCVVRVEGLSGVHIRLSAVRFEQNANMTRGGEDRVHHTASDLSNLPQIDKEEFKMIMCLIEQSPWFVRNYAQSKPPFDVTHSSNASSEGSNLGAVETISGPEGEEEEDIPPPLTPVIRNKVVISRR